MFNKLWNFIKGLVSKKEEKKQTPEEEWLDIDAERFKYIKEHPETESPKSVVQQKKLVHPLTKEEVKPLPNVNNDLKARVKVMASKYGWDKEDQWKALEQLAQEESSWNPDAINPETGAFSLYQINPQAAPSYAAMQSRPLDEQINFSLQRIKDWYGNPTNALSEFYKKGWH